LGEKIWIFFQPAIGGFRRISAIRQVAGKGRLSAPPTPVTWRMCRCYTKSEVRTYTLRPGTLAEFEERFAKRLPLREKHSKLGAFWHTEFGPLNQAIHVYPYDDLRQRTSVRAAMAQDTALAQLPGGGDLIAAMESEIMNP
jgi:hypothetical protein